MQSGIYLDEYGFNGLMVELMAGSGGIDDSWTRGEEEEKEMEIEKSHSDPVRIMTPRQPNTSTYIVHAIHSPLLSTPSSDPGAPLVSGVKPCGGLGHGCAVRRGIYLNKYV